MSIPPHRNNSTEDNTEGTLEFIETAQYSSHEPSSSYGDHPRYTPVPRPWRQYRHPNGDIYYYHHGLRLITPDDIRDPIILSYVMEAREDHLQCIEDDSNFYRLPRDWELTLCDVSESGAVIGMHSRSAGASYDWSEETGLVIKSKEHFWTHLAEYPSHHADLPPNTEAEFVHALNNAKSSIMSGAVFPFSERQIDQVIGRYQHLKGLQARGRNTTPALAWLMGAVMPLDIVGRTLVDEDLEALMGDLHF
ncbi:hypothetical protein BDQ12DRAFT_727990 [Crucibulum laeve]|uniref:WW domain-containing protein n=1 Tax=Crucibulum laeve TaxID=68775 RepID=A0A5C3LMK1_9AGAR|nr:hypothetical protein BDQ12DRAFT_727990 [Crucibulum laeve]